MRLSKISSWQKIARLPDCQSTETTQKIAAHATTDHNKLDDGGGAHCCTEECVALQAFGGRYDVRHRIEGQIHGWVDRCVRS